MWPDKYDWRSSATWVCTQLFNRPSNAQQIKSSTLFGDIEVSHFQ